MDINEAIDKWMSKELTVKELFVATGLRSIRSIYDAALNDRLERDVENYAWGYDDAAAEERALLEAMAWHRWSDWLSEEPGYLDNCVRMLKEEQARRLGLKQKIAAR
ncbi:hypothetical protein RlegWSM1455_07070 [Rhizobium laguerreae]|uniref:hypothetical protein n=1 Tax=Rhizobium laguerreae TaxID=1076926 RepID=UPI001E49FDD8|nr:hypothetical protein [Rhizobium laguerreae]UFW65776.1 hypothetical protein RlegWSM1455_07070 [Rhizobium laguerreae]